MFEDKEYFEYRIKSAKNRLSSDRNLKKGLFHLGLAFSAFSNGVDLERSEEEIEQLKKDLEELISKESNESN